MLFWKSYLLLTVALTPQTVTPALAQMLTTTALHQQSLPGFFSQEWLSLLTAKLVSSGRKKKPRTFRNLIGSFLCFFFVERTVEVCVVCVSAGTHRLSVIWSRPAFCLHMERTICHSSVPPPLLPSLLPASNFSVSLVVNSTSVGGLCKNS